MYKLGYTFKISNVCRQLLINASGYEELVSHSFSLQSDTIYSKNKGSQRSFDVSVTDTMHYWAQMLHTNDSAAVGISISLTTKIYAAGWKEGQELGNLQVYHMKQWSKPMDNKDEVPEFLSWKITFKDNQQNTNRYKLDHMKSQLQESTVGLMAASFPWKLTRIFAVWLYS